jgi:hypothetical protein
MSTSRTFTTSDPTTRVHFVRSDGSEVVVTSDGYETSDAHEIAFLSAHPAVSEAAPKRAGKPKEEDT